MTPEERIAQLEAALALEQAKVRELTATLEHVAKNATEADAARARTLEEEARSKALRRERNRRYRESRKTLSETPEDAQKTSSETSNTIPPLSPLDGPPSFPAPQSSPPLSPQTPPSLSFSAASASAEPEQTRLPGVHEPTLTPAKPKRERRPRTRTADKSEGDPRHYPLKLALVAAGWPFDGGKDAANLTAILALADQQEATAGENAHAEVLRRAKIAWDLPGYDRARNLTELRLKWARATDSGAKTRQQEIWDGLQEKRREALEAAGLTCSPEFATADYINTALARWKNTTKADGSEELTMLGASFGYFCEDPRYLEKGLPVKLFLSPGVFAECEAKDKKHVAYIADLKAPGIR